MGEFLNCCAASLPLRMVLVNESTMKMSMNARTTHPKKYISKRVVIMVLKTPTCITETTMQLDDVWSGRFQYGLKRLIEAPAHQTQGPIWNKPSKVLPEEIMRKIEKAEKKKACCPEHTVTGKYRRVRKKIRRYLPFLFYEAYRFRMRLLISIIEWPLTVFNENSRKYPVR